MGPSSKSKAVRSFRSVKQVPPGFRLPQVSAFIPRYAPNYDHVMLLPPWVALDPKHVFHESYLKRERSRPKVGLHWGVRAPMSLSSHAVVRNGCARQLRRVFRKALEDEGFTRDGTRKPNDGASVQYEVLDGDARRSKLEADAKPLNVDDSASHRQKTDLRGTLLLMCSASFLKMPKDRVEQDAKTIVQTLRKLAA